MERFFDEWIEREFIEYNPLCKHKMRFKAHQIRCHQTAVCFGSFGRTSSLTHFFPSALHHCWYDLTYLMCVVEWRERIVYLLVSICGRWFFRQWLSPNEWRTLFLLLSLSLAKVVHRNVDSLASFQCHIQWHSNTLMDYLHHELKNTLQCHKKFTWNSKWIWLQCKSVYKKCVQHNFKPLLRLSGQIHGTVRNFPMTKPQIRGFIIFTNQTDESRISLMDGFLATISFPWNKHFKSVALSVMQ